MKFAAFLPSNHKTSELPVLIWLSGKKYLCISDIVFFFYFLNFSIKGLTCNEQNFITKSGFQKYAEKHKIIVIAPDTSPRTK